MPRRKRINYPQEYIKKCFDVWYLQGRPSTPLRILEILPEYELNGKLYKPSRPELKRWMIDGAWDEWADSLDSRALVLSDDNLVNVKTEMLKRHQEQAAKVTLKALDYILQEGFDSASSAVQAFFRGVEEQRKTAGFSDLLERLDKMTNNDVEREIIEKLHRIQDNNQIIEIESEESEDESP